MANYNALGQIAAAPQFQSRVRYAMCLAAASVYSETLTATAATAAGNAILTFASVPGSIVAGLPVYDLTTPGVIPAGTTVLSVTATTVTLSANVAGAGVGKLDTISFVANHAARASFASKVASGTYNLLDVVYAVLGNSTIAAEAVYATQPDFAIPDSDIQFSVNSLWNLFAGA